ncbi:MAG: hypothetical protein JNM96_05850 [Bacteroidia bacterium]|nr:hypothetical protein [Bacteroidia bacterium]
MKKLVLTTAAIVALSIGANAQDNAKANPKKETTAVKKTEKKEVVNDDGTTSVVEVEVKEEKKSETPPAKQKTRMAINEKGLPGDTKKSTKTNPK